MTNTLFVHIFSIKIENNGEEWSHSMSHSLWLIGYDSANIVSCLVRYKLHSGQAIDRDKPVAIFTDSE